MSLRTIKTPALNLAFEDSGPSSAEPLFLLHGWPDSPRTWDGVLPPLHKAGYRTITPFLRGYGPSTFRDRIFGRNPRRTGQPVAFAQDVLDLADRLKIQCFHFIGHDWGARTGYALAALNPSRLKSLTTISVPFEPGKATPPRFPQDRAFWYQWLLCTRPGEEKFRKDSVAFCTEQWDTWSPAGWYARSDLADAAKSWKSKDFANVVLHSYRSRWGHASQDPDYVTQQSRLDTTLSLSVPTLLIHGAQDSCELPETTDGAGRYFSAPYRRIFVEATGHFPQRENPGMTAGLILAHLTRHP